MLRLLMLSALAAPSAAWGGERFACAGAPAEWGNAKAAAVSQVGRIPADGELSAVVIFGTFAGEGSAAVPAWGERLFDLELPGSFSHFYDDMSAGRLRVRGEVLPTVYEVAGPRASYVAEDHTQVGGFDRFALEVLRGADADVDFSRFDNDGPDGVPSSGDDDGLVDLVMIVIPTEIPANFLLGPATGIATLGFGEDFVTQDVGQDGPIRVRARRGTVQRGRSFAEAAGTTCHEFGHLLGLPDLFDVDFVRSEVALGPEEDSAGIGAWGLMGWGALGWNGDDGPNALSAWSRVELGWAEAAEPSMARQEVRLTPTGRGGGVFRIPLTAREQYLLEHRTRGASHYDRNLPAEGMLIWHVVVRGITASGEVPRTLVDLECADGKWEDAGYPLGLRANAEAGGDNLDFWAHHRDYAASHSGNLGDATDPFDGVRFTAFTPETNPASWSEEGARSIRVEDIRVEGETASATVVVSEAAARVDRVSLEDDDGDGVILAGEPVALSAVVSNHGGLTLQDVAIRLGSTDPLVSFEPREAALGRLGVGESKTTDESQPLFFTFSADSTGVRESRVLVQVLEGGRVLAERQVPVTGLSPGLPVASVTIVDTAGNGDGRAQAGELVSIEVTLDAAAALEMDEVADLFQRVRASLEPVDGGARLVGSSTLWLELGDREATTRRAPELLLAASHRPGDRVPLVLSMATVYSTWHDTIEIEVSPGADATPPRVGFLRLHDEAGMLVIRLDRDRLVEAGEVTRAVAVVRRLGDRAPAATVVLEATPDHFEGRWAPDGEQAYSIEAVVEDSDGNVGRSHPQVWHVLESVHGARARTTPWEPVTLPLATEAVELIRIEVAPANGQVVYGTARQGLWQSTDGGDTWERRGWMTSHRRVTGFAVSPFDPFLVYTLGADPSVSRDGGLTWSRMGLPDVVLTRLDPVRGGRMFGGRAGGSTLIISEDGGGTWWDTGVSTFSAMVSRAHPDVLYAGFPRRFDQTSSGYLPAHVYRSEDAGRTWVDWQVDRPFTVWTLDPHDEGGLYAASGDTVFRSDDQGRSWSMAGQLPNDRTPAFRVVPRVQELQAHPQAHGVLVASGEAIWRSEDGGMTWQESYPPSSESQGLFSVALDPRDPARVLAAFSGRQQPPWRSHDGGRTWERLSVGTTESRTPVVLFDAAGRLWVGSGHRAEGRLAAQPRIAVREHDGHWEARGSLEQPSLYSPAMEDLYVDRDGRFLAASHGRRLILSHDAGRTWWTSEAAWNDGRLLLRKAPGETQVYYYASAAVQSVGIWRTTDRGGTWEQVYRRATQAGEITRPFAGLEVDPTSPGVLYAAVDSSAWRSWDGGATWDEHNGRLDGTVLLLASRATPSFRLFAATGRALHQSDDGGRSWTRLSEFDQGLAYDNRLRFHPHDPERMYLAAGHRLLHTRDGGVNWAEIGGATGPRMFFYDVAVDPADGETLYTGTPWGVYRHRETTTAVQEDGSPGTPDQHRLEPVYPNPFNAGVVIPLRLEDDVRVDLAVFNLAGQRIRTIPVEGLPAGRHLMRWDGLDDDGRALASGVYLVQLAAGESRLSRKCVLVR